jgi:hypothetical protein
VHGKKQNTFCPLTAVNYPALVFIPVEKSGRKEDEKIFIRNELILRGLPFLCKETFGVPCIKMMLFC